MSGKVKEALIPNLFFLSHHTFSQFWPSTNTLTQHPKSPVLISHLSNNTGLDFWDQGWLVSKFKMIQPLSEHTSKARTEEIQRAERKVSETDNGGTCGSGAHDKTTEHTRRRRSNCSITPLTFEIHPTIYGSSDMLSAVVTAAPLCSNYWRGTYTYTAGDSTCRLMQARNNLSCYGCGNWSKHCNQWNVFQATNVYEYINIHFQMWSSLPNLLIHYRYSRTYLG